MSNLIPFSPLTLPPAILMIAFILDSVIGDPRWLPHPVRAFGKTIIFFERGLRRFCKTPFAEKSAGIFLVLSIVVPTFFFTYFFLDFARSITSGLLISLTSILIIYLTSSTIAIKELISSAKSVIDAVERGNTQLARYKLSMIVGRDTENLSVEDILKATIETLSENLSDGVIAPLFYLAIGGLPFALSYKAINTLDSMVGYRNQRYIHFGWASARLDDIVNYLPARISGFLIIISTAIVFRSLSIARIAYQIMRRDGSNHLSPNSGIPEAAIAGGVGVRIGGPSSYGGIIVKKPYIGEARHNNYLSASKIALNIVWLSSMIGVALATIFLYFSYYSTK
ncbi:MAG: adenosylcobinamide-phosphate synthase CbiB [Thermodesulfovibrionales bacterium]|nr:adenosylcobinamide-phosphate synthase CbiB [Thermodesulfovibrionales bacterium]